MFTTFGGPLGALGFLMSTVVGMALVAAWVILAASRFVQGGVMERPERVPQLYGYTACLIGIIWALVSFVSLVDHGLTLADPVVSTSEFTYDQPSVTSFEAFRATYDRSRRFTIPGEAAPTRMDSVPEPELHRRYEALRADRISQSTIRARRGIVTSALGLIVGAALVLFHWKWLRRRGLDLEGAKSAAPTA